jgi:hypothetical protein
VTTSWIVYTVLVPVAGRSWQRSTVVGLLVLSGNALAGKLLGVGLARVRLHLGLRRLYRRADRPYPRPIAPSRDNVIHPEVAMLGWEFFVTRQRQGGPIESGAKGQPLARWMAGLGGTKWIDDLVAEGTATDLGGNGYPCRYTVTAGALANVLKHGLPEHKGPPVVGDDYYLPGGWTGNASIDYQAIAALDPAEVLLVDAWDQS